MIRATSSNMIWKFMEKVLPKEEDPEILKKRLKILLLKDTNGMTVIDYGFLGHRYVVGEYIRGIIAVIGTDDLFLEVGQPNSDGNYSEAKKGIFDLSKVNGAISFPKLVHVHMTTTRKSEATI
jgi:hypothetical protein